MLQSSLSRSIWLFVVLQFVNASHLHDELANERSAAYTCHGTGGCEEWLGTDVKVSLLQTGTTLHSKLGGPSEAHSSQTYKAHGPISSSAASQILAVLTEAASKAVETEQQAPTAASSNASAKQTPTTSSASQANVSNSTEASNMTVTSPLTNMDYGVSVLTFMLMVALAVLFFWYLVNSDLQISSLSHLFAEFIGTYVLVLTATCCSLSGDSIWNPTGVAAVLMAMIYATGPISGGNLNPAVSISLGLAGKMQWSTVVQYCAVQILAGSMATFTAILCLAPITAQVGPVGSFVWWDAGLVELFYTAMLCFVVLNCAVSERNNPANDGNQFFGLAIGFVVIAGGYPAGKISGAHFNPAISFGFEIISQDSVGWGFIWAMFQCAGSIVAVLLFKAVRPEEFTETRLVPLSSSLAPSCFAEMIGTAVLVFTVGMNIFMGTNATAWSATAALMCMVYSLGDVSGAHFNPAVTIAVVCSGRDKCAAFRGIAYIIFQLLGGIWGGLLYSGRDFIVPSSATPYPVLSTCVGEGIFTTLLAYVVLATATTTLQPSQKTRQNFYFAICIGACILVGGTCIGGVSGGQLNPAVSLGNLCSDAAHDYLYGRQFMRVRSVDTGTLLASNLTTASWFGYPCAQVLAGIIAAIIFQVVHAQEYAPSAVSIGQKMLAEALGTYYLVLTVGFCSLAAGGATFHPLAIAMVIMVMVYSTAPISGGHLNPAVSLSLALCKQFTSLPHLLCYVTAQIFSGILAGITCCYFLDRDSPVSPKAGYNWTHAMMAESIYTFLLCFVVLNCAVSKRNNSPDDGNQFFGLAIGFTIIAGGFAVGSISGAIFNPAVAMGLSVSSAIKSQTSAFFGWGWAWSCFECMGSLLATLFFWLLRREESGFVLDAAISDHSSFAKDCACEFLGVFILVLTVGLNIITTSTATALSAAAALMSMIYSLGDISGAHFNPAVTLAVVLSGRKKLAARTGVAYVAAQLLGAVFAGHLYGGFHLVGPNKDISYPLEPGKGHSLFSAGMGELIFTSVLAYTVLATATVTPPVSQRSKQNSFFGLAIAACVIAGGSDMGRISGGELNPAVSLGICMSNLAHAGKGYVSPPINFLPFSLFQLSGGMLAAIVFHFTNSNEYSFKSKAMIDYDMAS